jgi:alcohol dehydrogenase
MRALVLDGDGSVRQTDSHPPPIRVSGEARIAMRLAGICDTDLQLARGYLQYQGVLGHEFVGEVVECDSKKWRGRRVVADINAGCGECADCRDSGGHHCQRRSVLGILGRDGSLAEELVVPEHCLVEVPEHVSDSQAVFAEPLAAAAHVLDDLQPSQTDRVLVLGDGKLGLLIAWVLAAEGVAITLAGHHERKLALAAKTGISTLFSTQLDPRSGLYDSVVEATGTASGLSRALELCRPRGTVVLKTTVASPTKCDLSPIVINELRVVGSRCGNLERAMELLAAGKIDPTPLIEQRYPLGQAAEALVHAGERGTLKILVEGPAAG